MDAEREPLLEFVQQGAFRYFLELSNPYNGLVADSTWPGAPATAWQISTPAATSSST